LTSIKEPAQLAEEERRAVEEEKRRAWLSSVEGQFVVS